MWQVCAFSVFLETGLGIHFQLSTRLTFEMKFGMEEKCGWTSFNDSHRLWNISSSHKKFQPYRVGFCIKWSAGYYFAVNDNKTCHFGLNDKNSQGECTHLWGRHLRSVLLSVVIGISSKREEFAPEELIPFIYSGPHLNLLLQVHTGSSKKSCSRCANRKS